MGNKGQTLVIFVFLLPILIALFIFIFEVGSLAVMVNKYEMEIKDTISYGLNHLDEEDLEDKLLNLLKANIDGEITLKIDNEVIQINVKDKYEALFQKIFTNVFEINITYQGYISGDDIIIQKE